MKLIHTLTPMHTRVNTGVKLAMFAACLVSIFATTQASAQTSSTNTKVRTSAFVYNANGLLITEIVEPTSAYTSTPNPSSTPDDCLVTNYTYDVYGNKTGASVAACAGASTTALSSASTPRSSTSSYAVAGTQAVVMGGVSYTMQVGQFAQTSTNAVGHSETRKFDPRYGQVVQLTGPNGLATNWDFDTFGRKTRETRADGTYTQWVYEYCTTTMPTGGVTCPSNFATGHIPAYRFTQTDYAKPATGSTVGTQMSPAKVQFIDALGRELRVQTQDFAGNTVVVDTQYNTLGQMIAKSQPYISGGTPVWSTLTYDALGRTLTTSSPDAAAPGGIATVTTTYNGLITTATNPAGQTKTTVKNSQGQVASVIDAVGGTVNYTYDALGQLIQTNAAGSVTTLTYDQRGRKIAMQDPAMGSWTYSYNVFGELVSQTDSLNQTTTMEYDALGRMTQRNEPDLVSMWKFDNIAPNTPCGGTVAAPKSVGKLCQATSNNGYARYHSYDSLGRPSSSSTVLDSTTAAATVSVAYHANTGRVTSKTLPTGYVASYTYNANGYLTQVVGSGAGATTNATLQILNYDWMGRVTQYKQGNNVVTNKTYDASTGRLTQVQATLTGAATGGIQNNTYTYDSLSNLTSRSDSVTGVSESFTYDGLNRLSVYTVLGGAVSPAVSVQTLYDARGNITYKSDVGQYWYDTARPNRMTNVTLSAPAGAMPLTGTRSLSYAFDDYLPNAKTVGTTTLGNGNLMYTVSQDSAQGKHTVRWESYTSFNMPLEIKYSNLGNTSAASTAPASVPATAALVCPSGYTSGAGMCVAVSNAPTTAGVTCPAGFNMVNNPSYPVSSTNPVACQPIAPTVIASQGNYVCPTGQIVSGTNCTQLTYSAPYADYSMDYNPVYWCNPGATLVVYQGTNQCQSYPVVGSATMVYSCPAGQTQVGTGATSTCQSWPLQATGTVYTCPSGQVLQGSSASTSSTCAATVMPANQYSCPTGYQLSGSQCNLVPGANVTAFPPTYTCPAGQTAVGTGAATTCQNTVVTPATYSVSCFTSTGAPMAYYTYNTITGLFAGCGTPVAATIVAPSTTYSCATGYILAPNSGLPGVQQMCVPTPSTVPAPVITASCYALQTLSGTYPNATCSQVVTTAAPACPAGYALTGTGSSAQCNVASTTAGSNAVSDRTLNFVYGPEHQRIKQIVTLNANAPSNMMGGTTWYLNDDGLSYEKEVKANGITEHKHYLQAAGITFAMYTQRTGAGVTATSTGALTKHQVSYFHQDHLGSTSVITNEQGIVVERMAYDPWGKRRFTTGLADPTDSIVGLTTDRGYTEHEMLDELGIIHMNGRVYDPLIGRFMSADPYIQAPDNLQSYNRYAYVMNNPLAFTDPSGYFSLRKLVSVVAGIAIAIYAPQYLSTFINSVATATGISSTIVAGIVGGGLSAMGSTAIMGGNLKQVLNAGVIGAFSGGVFAAAGMVGDPTDYGRYAAHALAGCVSSVAGGGKCGQGAASAVVGKWTSNYIGNTSEDFSAFDFAATVVAGGVTSVIGGGKFANGAETAAYGYLFNKGSKWWKQNLAKAAQGTSALVRDFKDAGWIEIGSEVNFRTQSGVEGRVDKIFLYKDPDGKVVYVIGEAKFGPSSDYITNQRVYFLEVSEGKFVFTGPKGAAVYDILQTYKMGNNLPQYTGAYVAGYGGSNIENTSRAQHINNAFRQSNGMRGFAE